MTNLFNKVKGKLTRKEKQAEKVAQNKAPQDVDVVKAPDVPVTDTRPAEPDKPPQAGPPKPVLQAPVQPDPPHGTQKPDLSATPRSSICTASTPSSLTLAAAAANYHSLCMYSTSWPLYTRGVGTPVVRPKSPAACMPDTHRFLHSTEHLFPWDGLTAAQRGCAGKLPHVQGQTGAPPSAEEQQRDKDDIAGDGKTNGYVDTGPTGLAAKGVTAAERAPTPGVPLLPPTPASHVIDASWIVLVGCCRSTAPPRWKHQLVPYVAGDHTLGRHRISSTRLSPF